MGLRGEIGEQQFLPLRPAHCNNGPIPSPSARNNARAAIPFYPVAIITDRALVRELEFKVLNLNLVAPLPSVLIIWSSARVRVAADIQFARRSDQHGN